MEQQQHFDDEPLPISEQQNPANTPNKNGDLFIDGESIPMDKEQSEAPEQPAEQPKPPVGTSVSEAQQQDAGETVTGLDADPKTAGRVDEPQAEIDNEEKAGHRGTRVDPTPHHHYTVAGVTAGLPTPETNAAAAFLVGNKGRFADLSAGERKEHRNADGVDEIAERAAELGYI